MSLQIGIEALALLETCFSSEAHRIFSIFFFCRLENGLTVHTIIGQMWRGAGKFMTSTFIFRWRQRVRK